MYDEVEKKWRANNIIVSFIAKYRVSFNESKVNELLNIVSKLRQIRNNVSHRNIVMKNKYDFTFTILIKETPKFFDLIYNDFYLSL